MTSKIAPILTILVGFTALLIALFVPVGTSIDLPWLFTGATIGLDAAGRVFLLFSSILWVCAAVYGRGYLYGDPRRKKYEIIFLAAMVGNLGLIFAQDAISFYVCFAVMSIASYGLVIHNRDQLARRAGGIYMILVIVGEVALFAGLVGQFANNGMDARFPLPGRAEMSALEFALIAGGFAIKAGVIGLHLWLPLAHPAAPVPASAVLSGTMIKAGLLGWIRFLPLGTAGYESWGAGFLFAGLASAFIGVVLGLCQSSPKVILAYSSISQMGFMTVAVGAGLLAPQLWPALLSAVCVYAMHHGLAKGALFLSVGMAPGLKRWGSIGVLLPAAALAGAPLTSGAVAKTGLKAAVGKMHGPWPELLAWALPVAAIGTGLLMIRFIFVLKNFHPAHHGEEKRFRMGSAWAGLVAASVVCVWIYEPAMAKYSLMPAKLLQLSWPVITAGLLSYAVYRIKPGILISRIDSIPPGDLVVGLEKMVRSIGKALKQIHIPILGRKDWGLVGVAVYHYLKKERQVIRWPVATFLFALVFVIVYYYLWLGRIEL